MGKIDKHLKRQKFLGIIVVILSLLIVGIVIIKYIMTGSIDWVYIVFPIISFIVIVWGTFVRRKVKKNMV